MKEPNKKRKKEKEMTKTPAKFLKEEFKKIIDANSLNVPFVISIFDEKDNSALNAGHGKVEIVLNLISSLMVDCLSHSNAYMEESQIDTALAKMKKNILKNISAQKRSSPKD